MRFPRFVRRVNRVFTNPIIGTFAWLIPPLSVVHHVGRTSGRAYRTPVLAFRSTNVFVIPMTYGRDVDWARNLVQAHGGEIQQMGHRFRIANPRVVGFKAAEPKLPRFVRPMLRAADFPGYVLLDVEQAPSRQNRRR